MSYPVRCPECDGEGEIPGPFGMEDCPTCGGTGKIDPEEDFTGEE